ncbi:MAG: glycosyltransferase [Sinimarinibacterium sp.]
MSRLAIFIPSFDNGGVERMLINLATGISARGVDVDFLATRTDAPYFKTLAPAVRLIDLGARDPSGQLKALLTYLEESRPDALLSAKDECDDIALAAKRQTRVGTRFYIRAVVNVSQRLGYRNPIKRWTTRRWMRAVYPQADGIVAVSQGVADDVAAITGIPVERIHVAPNPVVRPDIYAQAEALPDHPFYKDRQLPLVLGVGRFGRQKNFELLLKACALANRERPLRLIILGSGHRQRRLLSLASRLGIDDRVSFPGFQPNAYAYMRHADLFVLSSLWEGSPNVLTEALALGTPVVSTDCPSGPREILQGGAIGPLVPLNDPPAMARAILKVLAEPPPRERCRAATTDYSIDNSAARYIHHMGLDQPPRNAA